MTERFDSVFRAPRAITPDGEVAAVIGVRDGQIADVAPSGSDFGGDDELDLAEDAVLLPGLVDSHVHICEPANDTWEGFASATLAAAAGGITTLVDMPVDNTPPTIDVASLEKKTEAARGKCHVDVGFWGGVVPGNADQLLQLLHAGALGLKAFLTDSGSKDFPPVDLPELEAALRVTAGTGCPVLVHAEIPRTALPSPTRSPRYGDFLSRHPRGEENLAVAEVIEAARRSGGQAHVCHLSSSDALPMIATARREGVHVSAETCPHYLFLCAEEIPDGATALKCCPPIREGANRELLWSGLRDGVIQMIVSDHSPCTAEMKHAGGGDFEAAWGGISSLQVSLPVAWTAAKERGFSLVDVARWMARRPAELAGLPTKGSIAPGFDADFAVFLPEEHQVVEETRLFHRHPHSAYAGQKLSGVVESTYLRGRLVGGNVPRGELLLGRVLHPMGRLG